MKGILFFGVILCSIIVLTQCKSDTQEPADLLVDEWQKLYEATDTSFHVKLTFRDDGTFSWDMIDVVPGHTNSGGEYTATNSEFTLINDPDCDGEGVYGYAVANDQLTVTKISDDCDPRSPAFTGVWEKY
ncbi:MAG: DUF2314 domain-containing protein [Prolixibacteraceae bacterium]|nr:DUF2314 domain-containing protein [Prolixibacteraceae bacterium]